MMNEAQLQQYLTRINLKNAPAPTLEHLKLIQAAHINAIPFENLDVMAGREISLDFESLFDKIILRKRGGYCFELNTLYKHLLQKLGYFVSSVLGRVRLRNPVGLTARDHMANIVVIDEERYVTDIGFGGLNSKVPLALSDRATIKDNDGFVRLGQLNEREYLIQRQQGDAWLDQYTFEDVPICDQDIAMANFYMSQYEGSHFKKFCFVGLFTERGRLGLFNEAFSERIGLEKVKEEQVSFGADWLALIKERFGLELDFTEREIERLFKQRN